MFKIGEFSKLSRISIRMLRHYDEIGLLVPEETDPWTGYRRYAAAQLMTALNSIHLTAKEACPFRDRLPPSHRASSFCAYASRLICRLLKTWNPNFPITPDRPDRQQKQPLLRFSSAGMPCTCGKDRCRDASAS